MTTTTHPPGAANLDDVLTRLAVPGTELLAGGTDWYAALGERAPPTNVIDLSRVVGLDVIERDAGGWRLGAGVTWSALRRAPLPGAFDALKAAAAEVGSVQIQNTATLAGNLCTASPAADGVPPLLALDARVELLSRAGTRELPLDEFLLGPRRTARRDDELLRAIRVPAHPEGTVARFAKLGARRYLVISIAMVAVVLLPDAKRRIARARVAVGACSPVAVRLPALERALAGRAIDDPRLADTLRAAHLDVLAPIDDVRAPATYRLDAVAETIRRLLSAEEN